MHDASRSMQMSLPHTGGSQPHRFECGSQMCTCDSAHNAGVCADLFVDARLELAVLVLWSLLMYSLPAHKEFRFLLPALALLMPYCGIALEDLASRFKEQCMAEESFVLEVSTLLLAICPADLCAHHMHDTYQCMVLSGLLQTLLHPALSRKAYPWSC